MNKNTSRLLIYAVIFLAVLNVASFTTIGIHMYQDKREAVKASSEEIQTTQNFNGRYFRDQLQLSAEQMNEFREINGAFRTNARHINSELNRLRAEMMMKMENADNSTDDLAMISDSIGMLHSELKKCSYQYYFDIKSICTQEQVPWLNGIFQGFFSGVQHKNGGEGQRQRKGFGKNRHD